MGATASRSSPAVKNTRIVTIPVAKYLEMTTVDTVDLCGNLWHVIVHPMGHLVCVMVTCVDKQDPCSASTTDVSIEILDETGQHTMFHSEYGHILVNMREMEASSCVDGDGALTVRWTLSVYTQSTEWPLGNLSAPKVEPVDSEPAMVGNCTFTTNSFSKLKATLRSFECAYSKPFSVGGIVWFLKIYPNGYRPDEERMSMLLVHEDEDHEDRVSVLLVRDDDDQPQRATTAQFNFEFEGVANYESSKMTHTFNDANYQVEYKLPPLNTAAEHDPLIIRCRLAVIGMEIPSLLSSML
ncbi:hypothetical protein ACQJBY_031846 [Aegilops geniculata]